jgi:hypothetical protein
MQGCYTINCHDSEFSVEYWKISLNLKVQNVWNLTWRDWNVTNSLTTAIFHHEPCASCFRRFTSLLSPSYANWIPRWCRATPEDNSVYVHKASILLCFVGQSDVFEMKWNLFVEFSIHTSRNRAHITPGFRGSSVRSHLNTSHLHVHRQSDV